MIFDDRCNDHSRQAASERRSGHDVAFGRAAVRGRRPRREHDGFAVHGCAAEEAFEATGVLPTTQFEGYIGRGAVLIAEGETAETADNADDADQELDSNSSALSASSAVKSLGYCVSRDRYLKRDELSVIYQLCVARACSAS